jgi:broad-specificity NMP kinase
MPQPSSEGRMPEHITILLSGAPGTGKSTVQALAPYFFRARLGEAAAIGTDEFYTIFDPRWTTNNRHWWRIAIGSCLCVTNYLFKQGVQVVLIASNGLYTREDVNIVLAELQPLSAVYHITLDAQLDVVVERVRKRGDLGEHPPEWLAAWLDHIRPYYAEWTLLIDTSTLTSEQTLERIYQHIIQGDRRLTQLIA